MNTPTAVLGLALGGIARVGQVQLLQPFMSLLGAAVIAHEALDASNMLFALAVIVVVVVLVLGGVGDDAVAGQEDAGDAGGVDERLTDNRLFTYHSSVGR